MNKKFRKPVLAWLLLCLPFILPAQDGRVEMADRMRGNGQIYVVVAVVLTILAGLILYMIRLDRKIRKLEKEKG